MVKVSGEEERSIPLLTVSYSDYLQNKESLTNLHPRNPMRREPVYRLEMVDGFEEARENLMVLARELKAEAVVDIRPTIGYSTSGGEFGSPKYDTSGRSPRSLGIHSTLKIYLMGTALIPKDE